MISDGTAAASATPATRSKATAAEAVAPVLGAFFPDGIPVEFRFWDGTTAGPGRTDRRPAGGPGRVIVRTPEAIGRLLWAPGDLGLGRAYVAGDLDVEGDVFAVLRALADAAPKDLHRGPRSVGSALGASWRVGALQWPQPPPPEELRPRGRRHSKRRDARAIGHHYDAGNDFYRLLLGPSLTYSCARFIDQEASLEDAQASKHELVCRKLGLAERPGARLLDIGCGWGSMALHAAIHHDAQVVGITISQAQAELALKRAAEAGVADRVEIRLQDYRDLPAGERFDAISSIGMFEHVGASRTQEYFEVARSRLGPGGRMLNHAISSPGGSTLARRSFVGRYVFPDGELLDVGEVVLAMERAGFEVRDVESLREHYARTARAWVANLEAHWDEAVALVGVGRARIWRLYLAAYSLGFDDGGVAIHQVLAVVPDAGGRTGMPAVRTWT